MDVRVLGDAGAFLEEADRLLLTDEARHNLILGVAGTVRAVPGRYGAFRAWLVDDGGRVVAAAMRTPPYNLLLGRPDNDAALEALVAAIGDDLPGVVGAEPEAGGFAAVWSAARGVGVHVQRRMGVYSLERVLPVPPAAGRSRPAATHDRDLLFRWMHDFGVEVLEEGDPGRDEAEQAVVHRLSADDAGFLLWEDGAEVVSVAGWGAPTPTGIRVGPVYTPPALRGRGYATALVAELSAQQLAAGRRFCFLYTDLANPTSNAIYERIGYVRVCESLMVAFVPGGAG